MNFSFQGERYETYFEDKKLEEIADILEENVNTVKSRLYRNMKKLRIVLSD